MTDDNLLSPDPQPSRSDAVKNRALLLETAARLFAEQGVEAVTMSAIAEAAGVGKGTLYRHFVNKMELLRALLDEHDRTLQNRVLQRLRSVCDALNNLHWFLGEIVRDTLVNKTLLLDGDASSFPSLEHPANWWVRQTILGLLAQIEPPGDVDYMADTLYILTDVRTLYFLRHVRGYDIERIVDGACAIINRLLQEAD